jgi:hypothetical protein
MAIAGISIILILGLCNLALVIFQAASGLRLVKVKIGVHKKTGLILVVFAVTHALLAYLANR